MDRGHGAGFRLERHNLFVRVRLMNAHNAMTRGTEMTPLCKVEVTFARV